MQSTFMQLIAFIALVQLIAVDGLRQSSSHIVTLRRHALRLNAVESSSENRKITMKPVLMKSIISAAIAFGVTANSVVADDAPSPAATERVTADVTKDIPKVPLYTKKSNDLQTYVDIARGFKMQRPFGFNEFDGAGGGYLIKFASLFDVDENVVVGSSPATAGKTSITDYGPVEELGQKLLKKRTDGKMTSSSARVTDGIVFYNYEFELPLDKNLPRTGPLNRKASKAIELYQLCVWKGKLWSTKATSNDQLFVKHADVFRNSLLSFIPRL